MKWIRLLVRVLLPILVIGASVKGAQWIIDHKPEPKRKKPPTAQLTVEATRLQPTSYQIQVRSYGSVSPRTQSTLIPQVSGKIVRVASNFQEGGFFEAGEVLLRIDPRDYQAEVKIAEASLTQAKLALKEEKARSEQALRDWKRLGRRNKAPNDLVLRKPQMDAAQASIIVAKTQLEKAKIAVERTRIVAPYAGRILTKRVDIGQVVSPGNVLAEIYATDVVEIRLPLNNQQLEFVKIPEQYRNTPLDASGPAVAIHAQFGRRVHRWDGTIVRAEGAIDSQTRQLYVIAQIKDPYRKSTPDTPPLKIGQFVEASIQGRALDEVFVIPRSALYQGNQVFLVKQNHLSRQSVSVIWTNAQEAVVSDGLQQGDVLTLTPVGATSSGTRVRAIIDGQAPPKSSKPKSPSQTNRLDSQS